MSSPMKAWRALLATATTVSVLGAAIATSAVPAQAQAGETRSSELTVMTQNLYLGADLFPAIEASKEGTVPFLLAAAKVYQEAMASDFPTRAAAFAKTVKQQQPDIIGLQEVTEWIAGRKDTSGPRLESQDFLRITMRALREEGLSYKVVGVSDNASIGPFPYIDSGASCGIPTSTVPSTWPCLIQMKDRDVILVNRRTPGLSYKRSSVTSGQYSAQQTYVIAGSVISFGRGYVYADMKYNGASFRMANTHLEVGGESAPFQEKQAKQFVKIVKKGAKNVIATGDFNSDAYGKYSPKSYKILTNSYFSDSWNKKKDGLGLTCCQSADLSNPVSENVTRIDLVLTHGNIRAKSSRNTNITPFRDSPVPLWESDHASTVARLKLP